MFSQRSSSRCLPSDKSSASRPSGRGSPWASARSSPCCPCSPRNAGAGTCLSYPNTEWEGSSFLSEIESSTDYDSAAGVCAMRRHAPMLLPPAQLTCDSARCGLQCALLPVLAWCSPLDATGRPLCTTPWVLNTPRTTLQGAAPCARTPPSACSGSSAAAATGGTACKSSTMHTLLSGRHLQVPEVCKPEALTMCMRHHIPGHGPLPAGPSC